MRTAIKLPSPWVWLEVESQVIEPSRPYATVDYDATWNCACGTTHAWVDEGQLLAATFHSDNYWCDTCCDDHTDTWWACDVCGKCLYLPTKLHFSDPVIEHFVTTERVTVEHHKVLTERWRRIRVCEFPSLPTLDDIVSWLETLVADHDPEVTYR